MPTIDIDTKYITLIGTPLGQSFAARMQNRAYAAMGQKLLYTYTEADSEHLGEIVNGLRWMPNVLGFAVTKPNKVKVLEYLDELDPLCGKMGSCNTVLRKSDGRLIGYNTDGMGFYISLTEEAGIDVRGKTFFCFGTGGAARAMCSVLAHYGAGKIYVTSRNAEKRRAFVEDINKNFAPVAETVETGDYSKLTLCDVVMNASGVGMGSTQGQSPLPAEFINKNAFYFDACYNPAKTQFLLDAEEQGCEILNGLGMSLYQGAAQIKIWTGLEPPTGIMREELLDILAEKQRERTEENANTQMA